MKLKQLFTDDEAVSPVIGVILMVAITVILAAVIGAFVLDIGGSQESAPQVQWEWADDQPNPGEVQLSHGGGDSVNNPSQIMVTGDISSDTQLNNLPNAPSGTWTAGSSAKIHANSNTNTPQLSSTTGTLTLVWQSSDGSQSSQLSEHNYDVS